MVPQHQCEIPVTSFFNETLFTMSKFSFKHKKRRLQWQMAGPSDTELANNISAVDNMAASREVKHSVYLRSMPSDPLETLCM